MNEDQIAVFAREFSEFTEGSPADIAYITAYSRKLHPLSASPLLPCGEKQSQANLSIAAEYTCEPRQV